MPDQADPIQAIQDELAIRNLVARYSDAVGRRDEDTWAGTWTDDGVWNVGFVKASGRDDVVKTWSTLMEHFRFVTQMPQSGVVELSGDEARGTWHVMELGWPGQGDPTCTLGIYKDLYRRTDAGWQFAKRDFHILYMGAADLKGQLFGHPDAPLTGDDT
jgi:ketosteroid isomerase-like protein